MWRRWTPRTSRNADALREQVDEAGFDRQTATRIGDPVLTPADPSEHGALPHSVGRAARQFFRSSKGRRAARSIARDGYQAVFTEVKGLTGISTRVAIGPMIERDDATRLERELKSVMEWM